MLRDFSATLHSLCLGLLKKHFFVTTVLCKEGMAKVSEEKKDQKKPIKNKKKKKQAQLSTTVHHARGQRRLTEEELGTSQPFPLHQSTVVYYSQILSIVIHGCRKFIWTPDLLKNFKTQWTTLVSGPHS